MRYFNGNYYGLRIERSRVQILQNRQEGHPELKVLLQQKVWFKSEGVNIDMRWVSTSEPAKREKKWKICQQCWKHLSGLEPKDAFEPWFSTLFVSADYFFWPNRCGPDRFQCFFLHLENRSTTALLGIKQAAHNLTLQGFVCVTNKI